MEPTNNKPRMMLSTDILARANATFVLYPRLGALYRDIEQCWATSQWASEPHCMALEGLTGAGKTTLVKRFARAYPRRKTEDGTEIEVLYVQTPCPVSEKAMASIMLSKLGDPAAHIGTQYALDYRLINLLIACKTRLVILDDIHNLLQADTGRRLDRVSNWLKVLIKESGVPFLIVGISGKVEPLLLTNPELSRLFAARETLYPFDFDPNRPEVIAEFARFIGRIEKMISMKVDTPLQRIDLLYRLHYATLGIVANVMNLLRYAQILAAQRGASAIELQDLANAFDKRLARHVGRRVNAFAQETASGKYPSLEYLDSRKNEDSGLDS